jgi:hypothetical protein
MLPLIGACAGQASSGGNGGNGDDNERLLAQSVNWNDPNDPVASGCSRDAVTSNSWQTFIGGVAGTVEIRWSQSCGTNWTRVTMNQAITHLDAAIYYKNRYGGTGTGNYNISFIYTDMIYAPTEPVCAYVDGYVNGEGGGGSPYCQAY